MRHKIYCLLHLIGHAPLQQRALRYRILKSSVTPQHTINQISQWPPEIFATSKAMLVNEQHVMLEAGI